MINLLLGDCLERMKEIPDGSVDLILADPPYGTTQNKWDSIIPLDLMWNELMRISKDNSNFVFTAQNPFTALLIASNLKYFKQSLVWVKNKASGHLNANRRFMTKHEDIILFSKGKSVFNKILSEGYKPANYAKRGKQSTNYGSAEVTEYAGGNTTRNPVTLLEFSVINNDGSGETRYHPTQKPVALVEYLIKTYSNEGETVLDFTMGSGTTGVACVNTGRNFIGIEMDEKYFEIATNRISKAEECK